MPFSSSPPAVADPNRTLAPGETVPASAALLRRLLSYSIVLPDDWEALPPDARDAILAGPDADAVLDRLVAHELITSYQATRVRAGRYWGLVLGNYRVLDRIGSGGMAVVVRAEHIHLRRPVAVKVFTCHPGQDPRLLPRFFGEIRAVAALRHPHIVAAVDAGEVPGTGPDTPSLHYFVMEHVPGKNLEALANEGGPLEIARACHVAHQIADALVEAHAHGLIHRDIKPSNVLVTPAWEAKLLDFGLAHRPKQPDRLTEPGALLGTLGYMAPEQAKDASAVDARADVYGLGCTLFWALTGQDPFPSEGRVAHDLVRRITQPPPSVRDRRPNLPGELDAVVARMMAGRPEERYPTAQAVMRALLPFLRTSCGGTVRRVEHFEARLENDGRVGNALGVGGQVGPQSPALASPFSVPVSARTHQVLIVDDEPGIRQYTRLALAADPLSCEEAPDGLAALQLLEQRPFDLVLLDFDMPRMTGPEVLTRLRAMPLGAHPKVVMFSGRTSSDDLAQVMLDGADDFLSKPFSVLQLRARVKTALRLKDAHDRADLLNRHLLAVNAELERNLTVRDGDLLRARNALVLALAKLVEQRSTETGQHLIRLQRYCRVLAEEATRHAPFAGQIDDAFVQSLEDCAPLHDIGKVALPDHILLKPGKLDPGERLLMQAHTTIGADTLREVAQQHGFATAFLQMAVDIARHHHERWDGTGYPDRLAGPDIPLAARIVALADVYDALRSRRVYKPSLPHHTATLAIMEASPGHFDPALLPAFQRCAGRFEHIFRELAD